MVDEVIANVADTSASQDNQASVDTVENVNKQEATTENVSDAGKKPEKLFTRDEVAKIANAEKQKAIERLKKEYETAQYVRASNIAQPNIQNQQAQPSQQQVGVQQALLTPEQIAQVEQVIISQAHMQAQEMFLNTNASDFATKLSEAEKKYPDYNESVNSLELDKMDGRDLKAFVALLNVADNGAEILYDLSKNPSNYSSLLSLANLNPKLAVKEVHRISHRLKENEMAAKAKLANPPLSQVNPSPTGVDNGSMTIKDYKKQPWARG